VMTVLRVALQMGIGLALGHRPCGPLSGQPHDAAAPAA
jgi:hypothetical protein